MGTPAKDSLVPYDLVEPGFEAIYTGETAPSPTDDTDADGNVIRRWTMWTWTGMPLEESPETKRLDCMQEALGPLDDATRRVRTQISSLAHCDSGMPVTIDELVEAIGRGRLLEPAFENGCYWRMGTRPTQPGHEESLKVIETVLGQYMEGTSTDELLQAYPHAAGFIRRTAEWLGPAASLTKVQKLMIERVLLPFGFFITHENCEEVLENCYREGGRGVQIDAEIAAEAGLPTWDPEKHPAVSVNEHADQLPTPEKRDLFRLAAAIAHGHHILCDCHHSTYRWIETWIYGIGQGGWALPPTRTSGAERERLGRAMFGYTLGLDRWLSGTPMQFLLLDLGHVDLGFDPKNELLRVYAHLGDQRTPVKCWLAGCLWFHLHGSLHLRNAHEAILDRAADLGVSLREWMDSDEA